MLRKSFLTSVAAVLIISFIFFGGIACSKSPSAGQGDITVTSSFDAGHTHDVTISGADIENPPAAGKTIDTTYDSGHRHSIVLTQQDFQSIKDGQEITVTDSLSGGHTHTYVISQ